MSPIEKSSKLENVCYDIRGPVLKEAKRLEEEGNKVLKLNIGNPAPFGFEAPDEILVDVIRNLPTAQGYCDSKGLYSARKAIMQHYQARGMRDVTVEDIYIGNGVSELIVQAMQALLNSGDEMLVPAPIIRYGRRQSRFPAARRYTIFAMNLPTGSRILTISAPKSPRVRAALLLLIQTTLLAPFILKNC